MSIDEDVVAERQKEATETQTPIEENDGATNVKKGDRDPNTH